MIYIIYIRTNAPSFAVITTFQQLCSTDFFKYFKFMSIFSGNRARNDRVLLNKYKRDFPRTAQREQSITMHWIHYSKFPGCYLLQQIPEECLKVQQPKRCDNYNKDKDTSLHVNNNSRSRKFRNISIS